MFKVNGLTIKNFMSIGEAAIDFERVDGFTLIDAENHRVEDNARSNGSGKSSLLEALVWCLTGETIRGYKDVVNRYIEGEKVLCTVGCDFEYDGDSWQVCRLRQRGGGGQLDLVKNGHILPTKGFRDAESVLAKELPSLTLKFLCSTVVLGQGLPQRFTNNSPAGRKAVLEELTNADYMIEHVKERIKKRKQKLVNDFDDIDKALVKTETFIDSKNQQIVSFERDLEKAKSFNLGQEREQLNELRIKGVNTSESVQHQENDINFLNEKLNSIRDKKAETLHKYLIQADQEKSIVLSEKEKVYLELDQKYESDISLIQTELDVINSDISACTRDLADSKAMLDGGKCPTCGQYLPGHSEEHQIEIKNKIADLEKSIKSLNEQSANLRIKKSDLQGELKKEKSAIAADFQVKLDQIGEKYEQISKNETEKLEADIKCITDDLTIKSRVLREARDRLSSLRIQYAEKQQMIKSVEQKLGDLSDKIEQLNKEIVSLEEDKKSLVVTSDTLSECIKVNTSMDSFASRDFRGILLEEIIQEIDQVLKSYAEKVYGSPLTRFYQDGNSIGISFDGKEYESLSGGEKQKLDVLLQLSLRDLMIKISGNEANILVFDEVFDGLDSVGCEALIKVILSLPLKVFIISHHMELPIPCDQVITVVKEQDGIAHIEIR